MNEQSRTYAVGNVKPCCKNPKNRFVVHREPLNGVTVEKCGVCNAHHYRLDCDPILFGVDGRPIQ